MIVFAINGLLPSLIAATLQATFEQHHLVHADLWANAFTNLLIPAFQGFCALVYLDAIGYESNRSCGE
jgi:hypothetical protein